MPVITALEARTGKSDRVKLYLDDAFAFDLPPTLAANLRRGQALSEAELLALDHESAIAAACERALRFLSRRSRSRAETRRHLRKAGFTAAVIDLAIARMEGFGYIDDLAFARGFISDREAQKPMAPIALAYQLRQKGVERELYAPLLAEIDVDASAYRAARKQAWRYRGKPRSHFRAKLSGMLRRRGFDHGVYAGAIEKLENDLEASESDYFAGESEA